MTKTLAALAGLLLLAGCGGDGHAPAEPGGKAYEAPDGVWGDVHVFDVQVRDGKAECILWEGDRRGGLACDWPKEGE